MFGTLRPSSLISSSSTCSLSQECSAWCTNTIKWTKPCYTGYEQMKSTWVASMILIVIRCFCYNAAKCEYFTDNLLGQQERRGSFVAFWMHLTWIVYKLWNPFLKVKNLKTVFKIFLPLIGQYVNGSEVIKRGGLGIGKVPELALELGKHMSAHCAQGYRWWRLIFLTLFTSVFGVVHF